MEYYLQKERHGPTCILFALCNALKFYGRESPVLDSEEWARLKELGGCIAGPCTRQGAIAKELGLRLVPIKPENAAKYAPSLLTIKNPGIGCALHAVLVIGLDGRKFRVVNYMTGEKPVVRSISWGTLRVPLEGNPTRRCWSVRLKGP
jgi:hypothetical protein